MLVQSSLAFWLCFCVGCEVPREATALEGSLDLECILPGMHPVAGLRIHRVREQAGGCSGSCGESQGSFNQVPTLQEYSLTVPETVQVVGLKGWGQAGRAACWQPASAGCLKFWFLSSCMSKGPKHHQNLVEVQA